VIPIEPAQLGVAGEVGDVYACATDPSQPIKSVKEAWESAKRHAGVTCRFHDLRHTAATRMLEGGAPLMVVASLLGWSALGVPDMRDQNRGRVVMAASRQRERGLRLFALNSADATRANAARANA
jgi:integrase